MNYILLSVIVLLFIIENVYAGRIVTFSLITFGDPATVTITSTGETAELAPVDDFSGVQSATLICPDEEFEYSYSINGTPEGFTRTLPAGELSTHNEFVGRKETIQKLKGLGYPEDEKQWTRSIGKTELFDDSYIPTVIIDANSKDYFITPYNFEQYTLGRLTIISKDKIFTETDVDSKPKNRYQDKMQFRVKFNNKLFKRKIFKFRSCAEDPAFFREALYGDMVRAVGNPVHNQVIVRVYLSDRTEIGLFLMIEVTSSKSFIKTQFYGDAKIDDEETGKSISVKSKDLGSIYDCSTGADFIEGSDFASFLNKDNPDDSKRKLKALTKAMHELNVDSESDVQKFSKRWLDLDTFFKALALEYLTGHWDSYWMYTCNYVLYNDPTENSDDKYKFYFIDQDFDQTFGIGLPSFVNPSQSYRELVDNGVNGQHREAIDIFLLNDSYTKQMFENHLKNIVKHVFNPVALGRRIEQYTTRYHDDIEWDYSIQRVRNDRELYNPKYSTHHFVIDDYYSNLEDGPVQGASKYGLKQWINTRAQKVAEEFDIEWDEVPLDPIEKPVEKLRNITINDDDEVSNLKTSGIIESTFNTTSLLIATMVLLLALFL